MVVIDDEKIIENIETLIDDASDEVLASIRDTKFPVEDGKIKCFIHNVKHYIDATKKEKQ